MTGDRLARLPVWARDYIGALQRDAEGAKASLRMLQGQSAGAVEVGRDPIDMLKPLLRLPDQTRVRFNLDESSDKWIEARRQASDAGDYLYINGANQLHIVPRASNAILVYLEHY